MEWIVHQFLYIMIDFWVFAVINIGLLRLVGRLVVEPEGQEVDRSSALARC